MVPFLQNVTRGRNIPPERLSEVAEHYLRFGGISPINEQCRNLIDKLTSEFAAHDLALPIYWGNRNWHPLLTDVVRQMRDDGIRRAFVFITSPYSSYSSCRRYLDDIARARDTVGPGAPDTDVCATISITRASSNHCHATSPPLVAARAEGDDEPALLYSANSIPMAMAQTSDYEAQLREVARLVTENSVPGHPWSLVWQSRSGPPTMPWLEPDIGDVCGVASAGTRSVVVAPIGFISDHMEVVFDLDVQAAERAAALGLRFARAATGRHPARVRVHDPRTRRGTDGSVGARRALGRLGVRPERLLGVVPSPARAD